VRAVASFVAIAITPLLLFGCGGGEDESGSDDAGAAGAAMLEFFTAAAARDGEKACPLLTEAGFEELSEFAEGRPEDCEQAFGQAPRPKKPPVVPEEIVGPVGADDGFAIAVVRVGDLGEGSREENLLYRLREEEGVWRVDSFLPVPTPEDLADDSEPSEEARAVLEEYSAALAEGDSERACELLEPGARDALEPPPKDFPGDTYGPDQTPIEEFTPCEWFAEWNRPDFDEGLQEFEDVLAVGDLALGYPGDSPPTVLVKTDAGWRIDPVSLGVP
jgi:hypothetical protein